MRWLDKINDAWVPEGGVQVAIQRAAALYLAPYGVNLPNIVTIYILIHLIIAIKSLRSRLREARGEVWASDRCASQKAA